MSSLAAAQADGYYYPPDWRPERGTKDSFNNSHPLGKRARKIKDGIVVIRFELPHHSFCKGCERHLGKGTRFNAEKKEVAKYFSTPIYEFTMKCPSCPQKFKIQTDPKNRDYAFVDGIKRRESTKVAHPNNFELEPEKTTEMKKQENAMFALEHEEEGRRIIETEMRALNQLKTLADSISENDYNTNKMLRKGFRKNRIAKQDRLQAGAAINLNVELLDHNDEDKVEAARVFHQLEMEQRPVIHDKIRQRRRKIQVDSLFGSRDQRTAQLQAALQKKRQRRIDPRFLNSKSTSALLSARASAKKADMRNSIMKRLSRS